MKNIFIILSFITCAHTTNAQSLEVDLSKNPGAEFFQTVKPRKVTDIYLVNRSLVNNYSVSVEFSSFQVKPINFNGVSGGRGGTCSAIEDAISTLESENMESKIPNEISTLKKEIAQARKANICTDAITEGELAIKGTRDQYALSSHLRIGPGDTIKVIVTRNKSELVDEAKWTYIFAAEEVNHAKIFYGFSYLFANALTNFPTYYSQSNEAGDGYTITRTHAETKNVLKNISPTIMYSYMFFRNQNAPFKFGLTGGFMADLNNPAVCFSPSVIIGDNFSLNAGLAVAQKDQLKGQYAIGQLLKDNLDFDQLHSKVWSYDIFFSVAFHFNSNPFKKKSDNGEKE